MRKTIEKLEKIGANLGDLGIVQGEVAEDDFMQKKLPRFRTLLHHVLLIKGRRGHLWGSKDFRQLFRISDISRNVPDMRN